MLSWSQCSRKSYGPYGFPREGEIGSPCPHRQVAPFTDPGVRGSDLSPAHRGTLAAILTAARVAAEGNQWAQGEKCQLDNGSVLGVRIQFQFTVLSGQIYTRIHISAGWLLVRLLSFSGFVFSHWASELVIRCVIRPIKDHL